MYGVFPIAVPQFGDAINQPGQHTKRYRRVLSIPCETRTCPVTFPPDIEVYSLQDALYFNETALSFLVQCPAGRTCPPGTWPKLITFPPGTFVFPDPNSDPGFPIQLALVGCQGRVSRTLPANSTQAEIDAAIQEIINEVARQQAECDAISDPPPPNPSPFFTNAQVFSSFSCPACEAVDYDGILPWYITLDRTNNRLVMATGVISAETQAEADEQAQAFLDAFKAEAIAAEALECVGCTITTASPLPAGEVGVAYSETLTSTGTFSTPAWTIISGSLPDGLSLNSSTGEISGTPTTEQTSTFTVRATNGAQCCDKEFELEIAAIACPAFSQTITLTEFNSAGNNYYGAVGGANPRRIMSARQGGSAVVSSVDADTMLEVGVSGAFAGGLIIAICYVPTSNRILVAEPNSGTITVLNAETLASVGTISVSGGVVSIFDMTYDSVNDRVYVIWQDNPAVDGGTLSSFIGTTLVASTSVSLSASVNDTPGRVAFCVGTNKLYVSMFNATPSLRLQIYQGSSLLSLGSFALGDLAVATSANTPMACSQGKVWVQVTDINTGDGSLLIINSTTDALQFSYSYGAMSPRGLCWMPIANRMFTKLDSNIVVYSVADNTQVCNFAANEVSDAGLVADPDNDNVFVTGSGTNNMDVYT